MKLSNQQQRVYNVLKRTGEATAREVIAETNYPSSVIRDLRGKGVKIKTVPIEGKNYDKYILVED